MKLNYLVRLALDSGDEKAIRQAYQLYYDPRSYQDDPVGFVNNILGIKLWKAQEEILEALIKYKRVIVKSANGIGKSVVAACAAVWHYYTYKPSITLISAPTIRQVEDAVFKEIRKLTQHLKSPIYPKKPRIHDTETHYVYGFTATDATSFQGIHSDNIMVCIDEPLVLTLKSLKLQKVVS
jgi:RAD3-like DEAD/DEAH box helicase